MGMCIDCKYHEEKIFSEKKEQNGQAMFLPRGHYCNNEQYLTRDFVTGEHFFANCYKKNAFGECLLFKDKNEENITDKKQTKYTGDSDGEIINDNK